MSNLVRSVSTVTVYPELQVAVYDILDELDPKGYLACEFKAMPSGYGINVIIRRKHRWAYSKIMFVVSELHTHYENDNLAEMIRPEITKAVEKEL